MPWTELHGAAGDAVTQRRVAEDHPKSCRGTTQDIPLMQRLLEAGWDLDEVDAMGHTPLHVAAGSEEPDSGELSLPVSAHFVCSIMIICLS